MMVITITFFLDISTYMGSCSNHYPLHPIPSSILFLGILLSVTLHYVALHSMDPKSVKITIRCGICHINTKNTKHVNNIIEALKQKNFRIHSGYTQGYLKIHELFSRQ
jgi:hypothetical protein